MYSKVCYFSTIMRHWYFILALLHFGCKYFTAVEFKIDSNNLNNLHQLISKYRPYIHVNIQFTFTRVLLVWVTFISTKVIF